MGVTSRTNIESFTCGLSFFVSAGEIFMHGNQFSGRIPTEIGECSELKWLRLYENGFTGEVPTEIGNLMKLGKPSNTVLWFGTYFLAKYTLR